MGMKIVKREIHLFKGCIIKRFNKYMDWQFTAFPANWQDNIITTLINFKYYTSVKVISKSYKRDYLKLLLKTFQGDKIIVEYKKVK